MRRAIVALQKYFPEQLILSRHLRRGFPTTCDFLIFIFSTLQKYTKYYGADRKGSDRKWCVDRTSRRDPPWLEFDLLHRRFISRIEVTLFDGREGKRSQSLDVRTIRFSEDKGGWIGFQVSAFKKVKALFLLLNL